MSTSKRILDLYLLSNKLKGEKVLAFYVYSLQTQNHADGPFIRKKFN